MNLPNNNLQNRSLTGNVSKWPEGSSGRRFLPAQRLSNIVGKFMEPLFKRHGGVSLELIQAWPEIVGPEYRKVTQPEKIIWPRQANSKGNQRLGCLVVVCEAANVLYLQHESRALQDRINAFLGYYAIERIKIKQKPTFALQENVLKQTKIEQKQTKCSVEKDQKLTQQLDLMLTGIENKSLREALYELGKKVYVHGR